MTFEKVPRPVAAACALRALLLAAPSDAQTGQVATNEPIMSAAVQ